jgi:hypothetical protein
MVEFLILLVLLGALAAFLAPRFMRKGPRGERAHGTLLITGISPRPDDQGEQWVTISGVITGPTVSEHPVYGQLVVNVDQWPSIGDLMPVVYSARNPDNWAFAPPQPPVDYPEPPPPGAY